MLGHERTLRHRIIEVMSYLALGTFVVVGTVALVFYARGYYINPRSGEIIQNGLVLLSSEPVNADIYLDGEAIGKRTQWRKTIPAGEHTIALRREGYREWRRTFVLDSGEVLWLSYPLLIPQDLSSHEVARLSSKPLIVPSPNNAFVAVGSEKSLRLIRSDRPSEDQLTANIEDSLSDRKAAIRKLIWSDKNNRLLVVTQGNKTQETVLVGINRRGINQRLVSNRLAGYQNLTFVPEDNRYVYGIKNKGLWKIDLEGSDKPLSIAEQVDKYAAEGKELLTWEATSQRVLYHRDNTSLALNIEPIGDLNNLVLGRHDGRPIAAVSRLAGGTTIVYRPGEPEEKIIKSDFTASNLLMSLGTDYIAAVSGKDYEVYDVERARFHRFSLPGHTAGIPRWLTGAHLSTISDGQAIMFDFTGDNLQRFGAASRGPAILSPNQSHVLYSATSSVDKHPMLVDVDLSTSN